ncbi:hypothetical protein C8F04DRAFT_1255935 [Mycena alexandri]|uniref:Uncharacterized protein n=1 Tax=Mycena alexandri TaxID=1745969 RepID=A0AAD6XAZ7_9AGAR|nr:hypothetical protein C8F04DRAFT_1255935 [Mycena alexandri]
MPYTQAKHLQAMTEYLEAVGAPDIKDLPYGSGRPSKGSEELLVGSMMDYFWAFKGGEPIDEFSPPASTPVIPSMAPIDSTTIFSAKTVFPPLPERLLEINKIHSGLQRIARLLFLFTIPGLGSELMSAYTVRLFADYNVALITGDDIPDRQPAYYANFAQMMNAHDQSGLGWAYMDEDTNTLVWDNKFTPATPAALGVLEHEMLGERYLPDDHVAVTRSYFENAERRRFLEEQRELKYYKQRIAKRTQEDAGSSTITAETLEKLDRKRKMFLEAAEAIKKQRLEEAPAGPVQTEGAGGSGGNPDVAMLG